MKMPKETFTELKALISDIAKVHPINSHRDYIVKEGKAKDIEMRLRWDYFYAATKGKEVRDNLKELEDSHIDTALRQIMKEVQSV